jgi:hypothetical protein
MCEIGIAFFFWFKIGFIFWQLDWLHWNFWKIVYIIRWVGVASQVEVRQERRRWCHGGRGWGRGCWSNRRPSNSVSERGYTSTNSQTFHGGNWMLYQTKILMSLSEQIPLLWPTKITLCFTFGGGMQEDSGGTDEGERSRDQRMPWNSSIFVISRWNSWGSQCMLASWVRSCDKISPLWLFGL